MSSHVKVIGEGHGHFQMVQDVYDFLLGVADNNISSVMASSLSCIFIFTCDFLTFAFYTIHLTQEYYSTFYSH